MAKISRKALLVGAAAVALGVGAYAYSQRDTPPKKKKGNGDPPDPNGNGGGKTKVGVGKLDPSVFDDKVMLEEDPEARFGYTSFFTQQSEQIVISDLQGWKNSNNPGGSCTWVSGFDPGEFGLGEFNDHLVQARESAAAVLTKRYPEGKWRPYNTEAGTPLHPGQPLPVDYPLWQRWLFRRVELIANREVCSFVPPKT